ncbi:MAG TPA: hypothetical protein VE525_00685, partial [Rubrobacter sp.]|nr:hypothetical protein [Rubrobacter sp.]
MGSASVRRTSRFIVRGGRTAPEACFREEWCAVATEEEPRINGQIRAREVRLISADGEQLGIKHIREA